MSDNPKPIRASKEVIWHLTCGSCGYYWTYPTMQTHQDISSLSFHCPLCGKKAKISIENDVIE